MLLRAIPTFRRLVLALLPAFVLARLDAWARNQANQRAEQRRRRLLEQQGARQD